MIKYEVGMFCKHFKGEKLIDKNIYKIIALGIDGKDIDTDKITYSGDNDLLTAENLVVYANIFQDNKLFAREYVDISSELSEEKKELYNQNIKVQPLSEEEIKIITNPDFIEQKLSMTKEKYKQKTK